MTPTQGPWHLAPSLVALRNELDDAWPDRPRAHDGSVGDAAHATRRSDHNPDHSAGGVVRALDISSMGADRTGILLRALRGDRRVAYVIYASLIARATDDGGLWRWSPYTGPNPHRTHVHVSIKRTAAAAADRSPWLRGETDMNDEELRDQLAALRTQVAALAAAEALRYKTYTARHKELLAHIARVK